MANVNASGCHLEEYLCSSKGMILPIVNEFTWAKEARIVIYLVGMLWSFMGVSIIADIFMQSIETITSKTRTIEIPDPDYPGENKQIHVKVWNDTVANLTLMALGSSAPEILLSVIEISWNGFTSGDLGPSTIVGSAAFNLLFITGACMLAIPSGETRKIRSIKVFAVTATSSVLAYLWLIVILLLITPDYVDLWEAFLTLLFFPILVIIAYITDKDYCGRRAVGDSTTGIKLDMDSMSINDGEADTSLVSSVVKKIGKRPDIPEIVVAKLTAKFIEVNSSHSRAWYRMNAIRQMSGSQPLVPKLTEDQEELFNRLCSSQEFDSQSSEKHFAERKNKAVLEFAASTVAILEKDKRVRIVVNRGCRLNNRVIFRVETVDGTAKSGEDYRPLKQTMVFEPHEVIKPIDIEIIDDNQWEPDEVFFVRLSVESNQQALVGRKAVCQVTILNDDDPGTFQFSGPSYLFKESCGKALIPVERSAGADGIVNVKWKTANMSAINGKDFDGGEGELKFFHGEVSKMLEIPLFDDQKAEKDENFQIELTQVTGGAKLGRITRSVVTIVNDDDYNGLLSRVVNMTNMNLDSVRLQTQTWGDQFKAALNVNGGDVETATAFDYIMHFLTFGWKVIFALVPPPTFWNGWLAFIVALLFIAILTTFIGDLASIFGCLIGLNDIVTAITFVALGTSLPDLFASKQAAQQEKTADNSIGNVTGSNSVNVFLGLGLPWVIASIYWSIKGQKFGVPAGSLAFSVLLYSIFAICCITLLLLRRNLRVFGKAELGGPTALKIGSAIFLMFLWVIYVLLSSLEVYKIIKVTF